ncbi:Gfo/Idh/MocA family protein [Vagococcus fluvialis]|uniref:Gfo/Idh/MocA family protein n=1 Tax=Vagococcus fluvialis TaxID=2738 RepID=UPI003B5B0C29
MKIGIIGLGGIFQKAYLPVISANRHEIDYYFASQNEETKGMLKNDFGFTHFCESLEDLIELKVDACFIHSATVAHYKLAKQCLEAGIHVFMDKPLSEELEETTELLSLAEENNVMLMVGFNRRFAPSVAAIKEQQNKRVIYLEKNRAFAEKTPKFGINDMFLHLVDTAVYLLDDSDIKIESIKMVGDKFLEYAIVQLATKETTAIVSMDMKSGAHTEIFRSTSPDGVTQVTNLGATTLETPKHTQHLNTSDWTPTLVTRGFDGMVKAFLSFLQTGDKSVLRQDNVLLSHQICQKVLEK